MGILSLLHTKAGFAEMIKINPSKIKLHKAINIFR